MWEGHDEWEAPWEHQGVMGKASLVLESVCIVENEQQVLETYFSSLLLFSFFRMYLVRFSFPSFFVQIDILDPGNVIHLPFS